MPTFSTEVVYSDVGLIEFKPLQRVLLPLKRDTQSEGNARLAVSVQTDGPLKAFNGAMI